MLRYTLVMAAQAKKSDHEEEELRSVIMGESDNEELSPVHWLKHKEEVELREVLLGSSDNEEDEDELQKALFGHSDSEPEDCSVDNLLFAVAQEAQHVKGESTGHEHHTSEDHGRVMRAASALVQMHQHEIYFLCHLGTIKKMLKSMRS